MKIIILVCEALMGNKGSDVMANHATMTFRREENREAPVDTMTETRTDAKVVYQTEDYNLCYGDNHALINVNLPIYQKEVTAIIGPSGCGKSTLLKSLNRMVDLVSSVRTSGQIQYRDQSILTKGFDLEKLRTNVGMVFQKPNPFPKSIYDNVAYGPRIHGLKNKKKRSEERRVGKKRRKRWTTYRDKCK